MFVQILCVTYDLYKMWIKRFKDSELVLFALQYPVVMITGSL